MPQGTLLFLFGKSADAFSKAANRNLDAEERERNRDAKHTAHSPFAPFFGLMHAAIVRMQSAQR